jgi:hypothetical protein
MFSDVTLFAGVMTIGLSICGRGAARLLLAGSGFLLAVVESLNILSNLV